MHSVDSSGPLMTAIALAAMPGSCNWACSSTAGAQLILAASGGFAASLEAPAAGCCLAGLSVLARFLLTLAACAGAVIVLDEPMGAEAYAATAEASCAAATVCSCWGGRHPCFSGCLSGVPQPGRGSGTGCIDATCPAASSLRVPRVSSALSGAAPAAGSFPSCTAVRAGAKCRAAMAASSLCANWKCLSTLSAAGRVSTVAASVFWASAPTLIRNSLSSAVAHLSPPSARKTKWQFSACVSDSPLHGIVTLVSAIAVCLPASH